MENYNAMLYEEEMQSQEIQHVEKAATSKDYIMRYEGYMKGALERRRVRRAKNRKTPEPEAEPQPQEEPESAMETQENAVIQ